MTAHQNDGQAQDDGQTQGNRQAQGDGQAQPKAKTSSSLDPTPAHDALAAELASAFVRYVSPTARLLEVGPNAGTLSLRLAQRGFRVTVLTPNRKSCRRVERLFKNHEVAGECIVADLMNPPKDIKRCDLVFTAGMLEQHDFETAVQMLGAMRRLGRQYVAAVVPNGRSLAYWLHRYEKLCDGSWDNDREHPITSLRPMFRAAGLRVCEESHPGAAWTLDLLDALPGMTDALSGLIRQSWEQNVIAADQNAMLLAIAERAAVNARAKPNRVRVTSMTRMEHQIHELVDTCGKMAHARDEAEAQAREQLAAVERRVAELTDALGQRTAELDAERRRNDELTTQVTRQEFDSLADLRKQLHERDLRIDAHQREQARLLASTQTEREQIRREMTERLDAAAYALHQVGNTRPIRLAQFLTRLGTQWARGSAQERRDFLYWCGRKLRRQPTAVDPTFDLFTSARRALQSTVHVGADATEPLIGATEPAPARPTLYTAPRAKYADTVASLKRFYATAYTDSMPAESQTVQKTLASVEHHGIIVFPPAVSGDPERRAHQLLRALSQRGFLCLLCEPSGPDNDFTLEEIQPRLYRVRREEFLLPVLRNEPVLVHVTWMLQKPFADALPHGVVWYDLADPVESSAQFNADMRRDHQRLIRDAAIVTHVAERPAEGVDFLAGREDAVCVPNAIFPEDFKKPRTPLPDDLASWHRNGVPLIGYTGVVSNALDHKLVEHLAQRHPDWDIVLIGPVEPGVPIDRLTRSNLRCIGPKEQHELPEYLTHFDVAMLPLRVTDTTPAGLPACIYEYLAAGRPVVSAALASMKSIERDYVHLATGAEAFARSISQCLRDPVRAMASRHGPVLVERHTWPERADRLSQAIEASFDALEILAPLRHDREVALYCPELLDRDGNDWVPGGRQRYLLDLAGAVARTGYRPVVYQHGDAPWVRRIDNLEVRSLWRAGPVHASIASERSAAESDAAYFNQLFHTQLLSKAALYIYAPFVEAFPHALHPNIGISQGVSWDDPRATFTTGLDFWAANRGVTESLRLCDSVVASDASTSDWFRTIDHEDSKRITVLPTGVDPARFKPGTEPVGQANDTDDELEPLVVLYPRRLSERHGLYLVLEVADKLLEAYEQVQLHFVGDGDPADVAPVRALMDRWPERVYLDRLAFDQMPDAYRDADITLVPTLYGGGTNRACLEAMATGNAVIGTRIGGSTGLILDGFNGLLIEPTAEALTEALARLIQDDGLRRRLGRHARDTAKTSHIDRWRAGWHRLLTDRLPARVDADDVTQTEPRLVLIEMKKAEIGGPVLGWLLARLLEHGDLVYVFDHDERHPLRRGFGRLQWITAETAANVQPDLWIVDAALQVDEDAPTSDEAHSAAGPNCWIRGTTADPWPMSADAPVLIAEPTSDGRGTPIRTRDALEALGLTKPAEAAPTEPDENTTIVRLESTTVRQTG